jgi:uncharacterized protein (TIGR02270 family)
VIQKTSVIPHIIDQHAEEAAFLWLLRNNAVTAPHYDLNDLAKLDERVEANLDGLRIAGDYGWKISQKNLEFKEPGEIFTSAILALEGNNIDRINFVYQTVEESPEAISGLISALGWVEPQHLQGKVNGLLNSNKPLWRRVGIAACAVHRVDPGQYLEQAIIDEDADLSCCALRAAGELGRVDLKPKILGRLSQTDADVNFWAAWAAVLLGDRGSALESLQAIIFQGSKYAERALQLVARTRNPALVKELLTALATKEETIRIAIVGAGIAGDPYYIPWLIKQMEIPELARIAGEAYCFITGVDIAYEDLDTDLPEDFVTGPTENPEDEDVDLDQDEDLPCPDPVLIENWWKKHKHDFVSGSRYLAGKPLSESLCRSILRTGMQRQRYAAAVELALMQPTATLFETRANGKRQIKMLSKVKKNS